MQVKCQQSVQLKNRIWCLRSPILSWHCLHCWWLCFLRNYEYTEVSLLTASLPFDGLRNLSILKCGSRKVGKVRVFMDCKSWIFSLSCRIIISASCWAILSDNEWSTVFSSGIILDAEACFYTAPQLSHRKETEHQDTPQCKNTQVWVEKYQFEVMPQLHPPTR